MRSIAFLPHRAHSVITSSKVRQIERRIVRAADLIHKSPHATLAGLAIKARALVLITSADGIDGDTAFRHKLKNAGMLAAGILSLPA